MRTLKQILKLISIYIFLLLPMNTLAAWIDHFGVILNPADKANIWDTLDITIKALDKNDNIVTWYNWSILVFSETDAEASFPNALKDNNYTFTTADQWEVKFENAVVFNNSWLQNVNVYDLNDDTILWLAEINIQKKIIEKNISITIASPENWLTIWEKKITISWNSTKNHKIRIIINWSGNLDTTTNSNWVFEIEANNLKNWENTIKSEILNADNTVIWTSDTVTVKVDSTRPTLKDLKANPDTKVEPEWKINIKAIATPKLKEVDVVINDVITILKENSSWDWTYTWMIIAPKDAWDYSIDVILKDDIWHEIKQLAAWNINVKKLELKAPSAIDNILNQALTETGIQPKKQLKNLTITWLKVVELKTKSVLSWNPITWVKSYSVYQKTPDGSLQLINTTSEPRFEVAAKANKVENYVFLVKATAQTASWILYNGDLSRAIKVKTWPEIYILLLISILMWSLIFFIKRKA